jgi:hypothetical protein
LRLPHAVPNTRCSLCVHPYLRSRGRTNASAPTLKSTHADPAHSGMAGLRGLFDDSVFLADGASSGTSLASARSFPVSSALARMDHHVDRDRKPHRPVAARCALFNAVGLATGRVLIRAWSVPLFASRSALQLGSTRRSARSSSPSSGASTRHNGDSLPHPPSRLPRPSLRDAGLECRHGLNCLLVADCLCRRDGRNHDSNGRRGTGQAVRRGIYSIPPECRSDISQGTSSTRSIGIIRFWPTTGLTAHSSSCASNFS